MEELLSVMPKALGPVFNSEKQNKTKQKQKSPAPPVITLNMNEKIK